MMEDKFILTTDKKPRGDQPQAIEQLVNNLKNNVVHQTLLGATGTGKTFTIANVIAQTNKRTLVLAHNKTLAAQLYLELKDLFKQNKVEYFISYFDFYQPEAYVPSEDRYIEKTSKINQEIEMMRLSALQALSSDEKVILVGSVAAIYPSINPQVYCDYQIKLKVGQTYNLKQLQYDLARMQYKTNNCALKPGTFNVKGDILEIMSPTTDDYYYRISFFGNDIEQISMIDSVTKNLIKKVDKCSFSPGNEYVPETGKLQESLSRIKNELKERLAYFHSQNKLVEAQRLEQRTNNDLEKLAENGFCTGIENYTQHLELRTNEQEPYTVIDFFGDDWLLVIDESHMTVNQLVGMYAGDQSRKKMLVDYGFRLPSALNNRPLKFDEFLKKWKQVIYVSATPGEWEYANSKNNIVQQIVRPTGLLDPLIEIAPTKDQIQRLFKELDRQIKKNERTIVVVLTIRIAEELAKFLQEKKYKVAYLHNKLKTIERTKVLNALRKGVFDVVIGINLLREGLDLPEVSLAVVFDADKPGIFRSYSSLIQIFGRVARNDHGRVLLFSDTITPQMKQAIDETKRRREIQEKYNQKNGIIPRTIAKPILDDFDINGDGKVFEAIFHKNAKKKPINNPQSLKKIQKLLDTAIKQRDYTMAEYYKNLLEEIKGKIK